MYKPKLYIIVSKDFSTEKEADDFSEYLLGRGCGFQPQTKFINNMFVICRPYRPNDKDDDALYLADGEEINDGDPQAGWLHLEEQV